MLTADLPDVHADSPCPGCRNERQKIPRDPKGLKIKS